MSAYQAILLHVLFSHISADQHISSMPLNPSAPCYELLEATARSCLHQGIFHGPTMATRHACPAAAWTQVEEAKRFALALYRVYDRCVGIGRVGGSGGCVGGCRVLSLSDLRFFIAG